MDPGFCEDLTGRLDGLLIVLEDRLNCDDASVIHQFTGARHDALALEEIARTAAHRADRQHGPGARRRPCAGRRAGPGEPGAAGERARAGAGGAWITRITRTWPGGCTAW